MLDGLSGESPLHLRLAKELEELQKLAQKRSHQSGGEMRGALPPTSGHAIVT